MILLERPANEPATEAASTPIDKYRSAQPGTRTDLAPVVERVSSQSGRSAPYQSGQSLRSPRPLRPTRLYRLIQTQPGAAISLALGPLDPEEAPIASPAQADQPEPATSHRGQRRRRSWNIGQLLRFAITGGLNTLIDILVLNALVWLLDVKSTPLLLACNIAAYCAGAINSFILNKYWTFGTREPINGGELVRFALITLSGSLWSSAILWLAGLALEHVLINPTLWTNAAKIIAIGGTALISYLGLRLWVFVQRRPDQSVARAHLCHQQARCSQWEPLPGKGHHYQPPANDGSTARTTPTPTPHADHILWTWKGPETL
uniref:GtrA/DPMS transmembrane domain-containing protein n=1 Tax=Thermogemmatispora argillosa TaxID=2045280 RepID=A0A455T627_9CHLR|nr:hypothetical protein KTA_12330 [Thermogemmatispora argillosa]